MTTTTASAKMVSPIVRSVVTVLIVPSALVVLWQILATAVGSIVFPGPLEALRGAIEDLGNAEYLASMFTSLRLLGIAWAISAVAGAVIGFTLGQSTFWSRVFETPLFALYSIPKVTLYPVFLLLLGLGEQGRIAFAVFHGIFPMALLIMGATAGVDRKLVRLADALELNWWQRGTKILAPALLPTVLMALRISFGLTFLGLVLAEMFSSDIGLGHEIMANISNVQVGRIAGQVAIICAIAVVPVFTLLAIERKFKARSGIE